MRVQQTKNINQIQKTAKNTNNKAGIRKLTNSSVSFKAKINPYKVIDDPTLKAYLKDINRTDLLSDAEELILGKKIKNGGTEAKIAIKKLVKANLRFVVSKARKYDGLGLTLLDLIQEGNKGLIRAAEGFDVSKGNKFTTYAAHWIDQAIKRGIADNGRTIKITEGRIQKTAALNKSIHELSAILKKTPNEDEISEYTELGITHIREKRHYPCETTSLETPIGEDSNAKLGDVIQYINTQLHHEKSAEQELRKRLKGAIRELSPKQKKY